MHTLLLLLCLGMPQGTDLDSCRTCHPGAIKGLGQGPHRTFLSQPPVGGACGVCHGDAAAHIQSAAVPGAVKPPPPVAAAACARCHADRYPAPEAAAHRFDHAALPAATSRPDTLPQRSASRAESGPASRPALTLGGFELHGALAAGGRLVKVNGAERRFDEDFNLDQGFRLLEAAFSGKAKAGEGVVDRFELSARDIDDPHQEYRGEIARHGLYRIRGGYTRTTYVYDPGGDYQSFDFTRQRAFTTLDVDASAELRVFGSYERLVRDGLWTGNRIGNQNVQPIAAVSGVSGPRELTMDRAEVGVAAHVSGFNASLAARYENQDTLDRRAYNRPAPANPALPESEDWRGDQSLRGPGVRLTARGDLTDDGALSFELLADAAFPKQRGVFAATTRGFDIDEFVTRSDGVSQGRAQQFAEDGTLTWRAHEDASVLLDFRRIDRVEHTRLALLDVTTYPNLALTTFRDGSVDLGTRQEVTEASLALHGRPAPTLTLIGGYGVAVEHLKLPSYPASGNDFQSGTIVTHGILAGIELKPEQDWMVAADVRGFGTGNREVNETTPELGREVKGRVRYGTAEFGELFVRHRHGESDQLRSRSDTTTVGLTTQLRPVDGIELHATQAETWIDSLVLSTFYLATPTPIPTYVGFHGITHQTTLGLSATPIAHVTWSHDVAFLLTNGSFDVRVFQYATELVWGTTPFLDVGVRGQIDSYREQASPAASNYLAYLGMVFGRLKL